jgi:hypothetical protein
MTTVLQSAVWAAVAVATVWACVPWVRSPEPDRWHPAVFRTAWVAVAIGFVAMCLRLVGCGGRALWFAGCGVFVTHTVAAFGLVHRWSHENAVRHVEEASGFGIGIYVSYLFTCVWVFDAVWWLVRPDGYLRRPGWVSGTVYGFMGFVTFNGTIVYGLSYGRWLGVVGFSALAIFGVIQELNSHRSGKRQ